MRCILVALSLAVGAGCSLPTNVSDPTPEATDAGDAGYCFQVPPDPAWHCPTTDDAAPPASERDSMPAPDAGSDASGTCHLRPSLGQPDGEPPRYFACGGCLYDVNGTLTCLVGSVSIPYGMTCLELGGTPGPILTFSCQHQGLK